MTGIPGLFRTILHKVKFLFPGGLKGVLAYLSVYLIVNDIVMPDSRTKKSVSIYDILTL